MTRFFLMRVAGAAPTLFIIVSVAFFLMRAAPGGPFDRERSAPPDIRANLEGAYGLDLPIWRQYGRYLAKLAQGDFGPSFRYKDFSVTDLIAQGLPVTLEIGSAALAVALCCGLPLGVCAALRRHSPADLAVSALTVVSIAVPSFVLLPLLGLGFGIHLGWLPVAGWRPGSARHMILPALVLSLPPLGIMARLMRASMLEVLQSPYVRTAFAKGLPLSIVILRHALRPALVPAAGYLAPAVAAIMTGSLVVESVAGLPGIGRYLVQGALNRDYTLVMGMVILYSALLIVMGVCVDVLYAWLDPRVRFGA